MGSSLGDQAQIRNIDGSFQGSLVGDIEQFVERNMLQKLVNFENFVRIEEHGWNFGCVVAIEKGCARIVLEARKKSFGFTVKLVVVVCR